MRNQQCKCFPEPACVCACVRFHLSSPVVNTMHEYSHLTFHTLIHYSRRRTGRCIGYRLFEADSFTMQMIPADWEEELEKTRSHSNVSISKRSHFHALQPSQMCSSVAAEEGGGIKTLPLHRFRQRRVNFKIPPPGEVTWVISVCFNGHPRRFPPSSPTMTSRSSPLDASLTVSTHKAPVSETPASCQMGVASSFSDEAAKVPERSLI